MSHLSDAGSAAGAVPAFVFFLLIGFGIVS
jgi:hypothetical protein